MSRHYCFTSYHPDVPALLQKGLPPNASYVVAQLETCPSTGRRHVQGYVQLVTRKRYAGVQKDFGDPDMHLETPRGSLQQNIDYCTKEETRTAGPWIHGTPRTQGQRSDLETLLADIKDGRTLRDVIDDHTATVARHLRFTHLLFELQGPPPRPPPTVYFVWGSSGAGKTSWAYAADPDLYSLAQYRPEWWDGYIDQDTVLLDDLAPDSLPRDRLLRLTDRYPVQLPIKGSFRWLVAKTIIITSNYPPSHFAPELRRRLTEIISVSVTDNLNGGMGDGEGG